MPIRPDSTQSRVHAAIKANGDMTVIALRQALGLEGEKGYARISRACQDLMRAGRIERSAPGTYRHLSDPKDLDYADCQRQMVRLIRIRTKRNKPLTARELSERCGCTVDWARRYVFRLKKDGFLIQVGFERVGPSRVKAPAYLAAEEKLNEEWPVLRRQKKTARIDEAVVRIRDMAFRVAREIEADKESLTAMRAALGSMCEMVDDTLAALKKPQKQGGK